MHAHGEFTETISLVSLLTRYISLYVPGLPYKPSKFQSIGTLTGDKQVQTSVSNDIHNTAKSHSNIFPPHSSRLLTASHGQLPSCVNQADTSECGGMPTMRAGVRGPSVTCYPRWAAMRRADHSAASPSGLSHTTKDARAPGTAASHPVTSGGSVWSLPMIL